MENKHFTIGMSYIGCFLVLETLGVFDLIRQVIMGG